MKWFWKLFIPKHELPLMEQGEKATKVFWNGSKVTMLDKHGNGFQFFMYDDMPSILSFMVDGTTVDDEDGGHYISFGLTHYLKGIAGKVEDARAKARKQEYLDDFIAAIHKYGSTINK